MMGNPMDGLQHQINEINHKVDQLHHIVEQLTKQIVGSSGQYDPMMTNRRYSVATMSHQNALPKPTALPTHGHLKSVMEHKDILVDDRASDTLVTTEGEVILTTDIQVRRLTAQLTAAYNRIAALEEQLLARRRTF
ncbi:integrase [Aphanothece sacrum FPU1]|uniref:Integrase n=2 Tax=Aphanothece sacrum TaxID=1122 RepID=A0A401IJB1_APHSA|nr:hypothetical protein [Aphanothece sacrum]GBF81392.1 integrase [Aphanothece sacrum FPU1]GBF85417.1 integrase [Aphanothece sacrum FPU3]